MAGDRLPLRRMRATDRDESRIEGLDLKYPAAFRAIAGPQSDYFAESEIAALFASEYTVGAGSNRMGMRLEGRPIAHARGHNIASDAIAPGSIQVPGNGQPIVLLADRQTTGGYPKIATVISADLPALGRLPIGAKIRFESVTVEQAQRHCAAVCSPRSSGSATRIVPIGRSGADTAGVSPKLSDHNLISGVVDASDWVI